MNSIKAVFINMSSWAQLLFLGLFVFMGLVLAITLSTVVAVFFAPQGTAGIYAIKEAMNSLRFLWVSQFITQVLVFLLPGLMCAYLFNNKSVVFLKLNGKINLDLFFLSILLIIIVQPIISLVGYYNSQMQLPEFISGIEVWMKNSEESARLMMEKLLAPSSPESLAINIFVIAIMAGIVEEVLFRGALQQILNKITCNYHWAVWVAAFIFSAIHFQFYGFIPRLLLGALLGYIFVWTGNLLIPIIIHALNNLASIVIYKLYNGMPEYDDIESMGSGSYWWVALISLVLTGVIFSYMRKQYTIRIFNDNDY